MQPNKLSLEIEEFLLLHEYVIDKFLEHFGFRKEESSGKIKILDGNNKVVTKRELYGMNNYNKERPNFFMFLKDLGIDQTDISVDPRVGIYLYDTKYNIFNDKKNRESFSIDKEKAKVYFWILKCKSDKEFRKKYLSDKKVLKPYIDKLNNLKGGAGEWFHYDLFLYGSDRDVLLNKQISINYEAKRCEWSLHSENNSDLEKTKKNGQSGIVATYGRYLVLRFFREHRGESYPYPFTMTLFLSHDPKYVNHLRGTYSSASVTSDNILGGEVLLLKKESSETEKEIPIEVFQYIYLNPVQVIVPNLKKMELKDLVQQKRLSNNVWIDYMVSDFVCFYKRSNGEICPSRFTIEKNFKITIESKRHIHKGYPKYMKSRIFINLKWIRDKTQTPPKELNILDGFMIINVEDGLAQNKSLFYGVLIGTITGTETGLFGTNIILQRLDGDGTVLDLETDYASEEQFLKAYPENGEEIWKRLKG